MSRSFRARSGSIEKRKREHLEQEQQCIFKRRNVLQRSPVNKKKNEVSDMNELKGMTESIVKALNRIMDQMKGKRN